MKKSALLLLFTAFFASMALGQNHRGATQVLRFSTPEKVAFAAFRRGDAPLKFALPAGDSLALQSARTEGSGRRLYRLQQMHGGIPVFGADGILLEENGALIWGKGRFRQRIDAETTPALVEKAALNLALSAMPAEKYAWQEPAYERELKTASADPAASFFPKGKLVFLPDDLSDPESGSIRLAWQFDVFAAAPEPARQLVFVDARDGKILRSIPLLHSGHVPAKGLARYVSDTVAFNTESLPGDTLYRLRDLIRNIHVRDALNLQSNPNADFVHNGTIWDKPEHRTPVAAHWGMEQWYDYMLQTHGWQGFTNDSTPMLAWAHFDHNFNNAFWNGNWVNFGDGDGIRFEPLVQLDIVAHECAHALVQNTCGLIYQGEPGALNEGLCDIFATLVERYAFPNTWNWKLGEAAYFDHANGLRRLDYPNAAGHPDTYGGQFWVNTEGCAPGVANDQCGIHANCGVLGKFFYILAQGEAGVSEAGMPYNVSGIGMNKAAEIIYRSLYYLLPTDGFADMRAATLEAAYKLYPGTEAEVAKAWCAVGVGECTVAVSDSIVLLTPAAVDTFQHGQPIEVLWTATAGVEKVNLYLSLNDGASWQLIRQGLEAAGGQFEFPAPPVFSPVCRLRLADAENPFVSDRSDTTFAITGCGLKAHFIPSVTKVCYGQPFYAVNDSPDKDTYFQWRWNGTDFPSSDSLLEIPAMTLAGEHLIELIADDSAGCRDTFGLRMTVLPQVTAAFSAEAHGNTLVANAHYQGADTYVWYYGGQKVGSNSPALTLTGLTPGTDSLRLIVAENGCPGGVAEAVEGVTVVAGALCIGNDQEVRQITYTNDVVGIAELGDKLYLAMPGCAAELNKNTHVFKIFKPENTGGILTLPLTSVTVRNDGKILFGSEFCGLAVYDPLDGSWGKIDNNTWLPSNQVERMVTASNGNTWILTKFSSSWQLVLWTANGDIFYFPSFYNVIKSMEPVGTDLWICGNSGPNYIKKAFIKNGLGVIEDVTEPAVLQNTSFRSMGSNGAHVWFWQQNTYSFIDLDLSSNTAVTYNATNSNLPASGINVDAIAGDQAGGAWLMTGYKPYRYDGAGGFISVNDPAFNTGSQNTLFLDAAQTLWMGTRTGLRKFANNTGAIVDLSTNGFKATAVATTQISDVEAVPGGDRVAVSQNANFFETTHGIAQPVAPGCASGAGNFAIDSSGTIWNISGKTIGKVTFGGQCTVLNSLPGIPVLPSLQDVATWGKYVAFRANGQLLLFDPVAETTENIAIPTGYWRFARGQATSLWAKSTADTLLEIRPDFSVHVHPTLPPTGYGISGFAADKNGNVWFAREVVSCCPNYSHTIHRRHPDGVITPVSTLNSAFNIFPNCIETDDEGNLWVGYSEKGLVKYSPLTDQYELFTTCDGLPDNTVTGVAFSANGQITAATLNGVGVITPSANVVTASFDASPACRQVPVTFKNITLGATSFEWRLDDQPIATTKNLTYTFNQPGLHILTLVARNAQGCETALSRVIEVYPAADLSQTPATWANCDNSTQLEAPAGMAAYEWREASGKLVGTAQKLPVTQSGLYSLKVTDHCGGGASQQITVLLADCVWPGDVNADGVVDYRDWVAMTLVFGYTGPARDEQGTSFQGYPALPWNGQLPNGANIKHADADGNGSIDMADFEAIEVNYGKTHGAFPGLDGPKPSPMQFIPVILEAPTDSNGHKMTLGILAIDSSGLLNSFSGAGFVLGWNNPAPVKLDGPPQANFSIATSIGKEGSTVQSIARYLPDRNEIHLARAVTDHRNRTNVSLLAQVDFIVIEDNIGIGDTLDIIFSISGAQALTGDGAFLPIGAGQGKFAFAGDTVVVHTDAPFRSKDFDLLVFPNPSDGLFTAIMPASGSEKTILTVYDAQGRPVWLQEKVGAGAVDIDLTALPAGSYYLRAVGAKGQAVRKLMKM